MAKNIESQTKRIDEILQQAISLNPSLRIIFSRDESKKSFDIVNNKIVGLDSTELTEKFAALVVALRMATSDELRAIAQRETKTAQVDHAIISLKKLTPQDVHKVFSLQLSRMIKSLVDWPTIEHHVFPREFPADQQVKEPLVLEELFLNLWRTAPPQENAEAIQSRPEVAVSIAPEKMNILKKLSFTAKEGRLLTRLNGQLPITQITKMVNLSLEEVFAKLAILDKLGFLVFTETASPGDKPARWDMSKPVSGVEGKIAEIKELLEELETQDYYAVLSTTPEDFSLSQLKTNYYAMAKKYHPDKFSNFDSAELKVLLENLLHFYNTAYETLKDPQKRQEYDSDLNTGLLKNKPGAPAASMSSMDDNAQANFDRGRSLINSQKYAEAIAYLKRSVQIKPDNGDYHAYLGYAMSKTQQFHRESEKHFLRAIELNPMNYNTYIHLGRIYREAKMYTKAMNMFETALRWDPENKLIHKEIEELNEATGKKSKGFLGNLFKK